MTAGQELKIIAPSGGTHGIYLWEKLVNGTWTNVNHLNQSSAPNEFVRTSSQSDDEGTYRYAVSNSWVSGLTFESGPIEVTDNRHHFQSGGASHAQNWKYVKQIGDPSLRMINQGLRNMKVPINNWRFKDARHIHIKQ